MCLTLYRFYRKIGDIYFNGVTFMGAIMGAIMNAIMGVIMGAIMSLKYK